MIDFTGQVVLVTGGGAGIGRATAQGFQRLGADVAVVEVDPARAAEVRAELGPDSLVLEADATDADAVADAMAAVQTRFGRLNVLVNNVGHFLTRPTPFERLTDDQIDRIYRINLGHVFLVTRAALPLLRAAGGASIVNVPEGIRVNAVAPETTDSAQVPLNRMIHESQRHQIPRWIPLGRFGTPQDIAGCVLFLASPLAAWVSGTVVHADGGALAAAGWYRDDQGAWTNMPVIKGNSARAAQDPSAN
jgi:NAD(P)-dependent dehydrogenase (short-subunit alcohol dehydrogenase family)